MGRRSLFVTVGWLVAAVAATGAGLAAVRVIGDGIGAGKSGHVVGADQVARDLAAATGSPAPAGTPAATASPAATPSAASSSAVPSAAAARTVRATPGGTVIVTCAGSIVRLTTSPAQGFRVAREDTEPDDHARVVFAGPGGRIEVDARCRAGQPTVTWKRDD
ncbi:septum formation initiator [Micromonospora sp. PLK6-60]|uniref:septum formation initiator n=1 Tax=Micromonospora sp. PLK6-60 TaxID=2873383 RepID=UPI001CA6F787|nr:septum formation initiator [Micromonospora sp. PLK6-60]MBY8875656.1 septum formation initiator [Micromonospora sp. PLK6-60]